MRGLDRLLLDDLVAVVRGHDLLAVHAQVAGKNEVPRPVFVDQDELTERGINASETCDLGALAKKATRWPPVTGEIVDALVRRAEGTLALSDGRLCRPRRTFPPSVAP